MGNAIPEWALHPESGRTIPTGTRTKLDRVLPELPHSARAVLAVLDRTRHAHGYPEAVNLVTRAVWPRLDAALDSGPYHVRAALLALAARHWPPRAAGRVVRRLLADPDRRIRARAREAAAALPPAEGVPARPKAGRPPAPKPGLPAARTVGELRELLGVRSPGRLGYLLLASDRPTSSGGPGPYRVREIPKRDGSPRKLCAPCAELKAAQRRVLDRILAAVPAHPAAHGFVPGRSIATNAAPHCGAAVVVKFDLKDFFPSVRFARVLGLFASLGYPAGDGRFGAADGSDRVAPTLARLCCYAEDPAAWAEAGLPQGSPASPAVANLVCRRLDARLSGLAARLGGAYTRYADDLTFSFKDPAVRVGRLKWWVERVCLEEGFAVRPDKFRVLRRCRRQSVTGVVVNDRPSVPRERRRALRAILHNCGKTGVAAQAARHPRFGGDAAAFARYVRGLAAYVHMVQHGPGAGLVRRAAEVTAASE